MLRYAVISWVLLTSCSDAEVCLGGGGDTGRCCRLLGSPPQSFVPVTSSATTVVRNPAFDCEQLTCASTGGPAMYCTQECECAGDCPEDFSCEPIPGAPELQGTKFCLKGGLTCS